MDRGAIGHTALARLMPLRRDNSGVEKSEHLNAPEQGAVSAARLEGPGGVFSRLHLHVTVASKRLEAAAVGSVLRSPGALGDVRESAGS